MKFHHRTLLPALLILTTLCAWSQDRRPSLQPNGPDRLYVSTQKSLFKAGQYLQFSVFFENKGERPELEAKNLRFELRKPDSTSVASMLLASPHTGSSGQLLIPHNLPGGVYTLAVLQYPQPEGLAPLFEKTIVVQTVRIQDVILQLEFAQDSYLTGDTVVVDVNATDKYGQAISGEGLGWKVLVDGDEVESGAELTLTDGSRTLRFPLPPHADAENAILVTSMRGETSAKRIPVTSHDARLTLHPEGGSLVAGRPNRLIFELTNKHGIPLTGHGSVQDEDGKLIGQWNTLGHGLGSIGFNGRSASYTFMNPDGRAMARIDTEEAGIQLRKLRQDTDRLEVELWSAQKQDLQFVWHTSTTNYSSGKVQVSDAPQSLSLDLKRLPKGIIGLTLLDRDLQVVAERLFFNTHGDLPHVEIQAQDSMWVNQQGRVDINVTDAQGNPMDGTLSVSMVDQRFLQRQNDENDNIISWFLYSADLGGSIHDPTTILEMSQEKRNQILDLVAASRSWKHDLRWKMGKEPEAIKAKYEYVIRGRISLNGREPNERLKLIHPESGLWVRTEKDGSFEFRGVPPAYSTMLQSTYQGQDYHFYVNRWVEEAKMEPEPTASAEGFTVPGEPQAPQEVRASAESSSSTEAKTLSSVEIMKVPAINSQSLDVMACVSVVRIRPAENGITAKTYLPRESLQATFDGRTFYELGLHRQNRYYGHQNRDEDVLLWLPNLQVSNGRSYAQYWPREGGASYLMKVEGIADGMPVYATKVIKVMDPLSTRLEMPANLVEGDRAMAKLVLEGKQGDTAYMNWYWPHQLTAQEELPNSIPLGNGRVELNVPFKVGSQTGDVNLRVTSWLVDGKTKYQQDHHTSVATMHIQQAGERKVISQQMADSTISLSFSPKRLQAGSLSLTLDVWTSFTSSLENGTESMLREPHGCFEQVSSSNYPNVLALKALKHGGVYNPQAVQKAKDLIEKGYRKLVAYEVKGGGFEWYGRSPAHEGLTAYGLIQFTQMKALLPDLVDDDVISRTTDWLLDRRTSDGFKQNHGKYGFSSTSHRVNNAYILYALSEAQVPFSKVEKQMEEADRLAQEDKDDYRMALLANAWLNFQMPERAETLLQSMDKHLKSGKFNAEQSMVRSYGQSLQTECAALYTLALLKLDPDDKRIGAGVKLIRSSSRGKGSYGSTQATALSLQALSEVNIHKAKELQPITMKYSLNGKEWTYRYEPSMGGQAIDIAVDDLNQVNEFQLLCAPGTKPFVQVTAEWVELPNSFDDALCPLVHSIAFSDTSVTRGDYVTWTVEVANREDRLVPNPLVRIGLPGGMELPTWELQTMAKNPDLDFVEIHNGELVFYFDEFQAFEKRSFQFQMKAIDAGQFNTPLSRVYPYYDDEHRSQLHHPQINIALP